MAADIAVASIRDQLGAVLTEPLAIDRVTAWCTAVLAERGHPTTWRYIGTGATPVEMIELADMAWHLAAALVPQRQGDACTHSGLGAGTISALHLLAAELSSALDARVHVDDLCTVRAPHAGLAAFLTLLIAELVAAGVRMSTAERSTMVLACSAVFSALHLEVEPRGMMYDGRAVPLLPIGLANQFSGRRVPRHSPTVARGASAPMLSGGSTSEPHSGLDA